MAIGDGLAGGEDRQGQSVACQFAVGPHPSKTQREQRIEPVQNVEDTGDVTQQDVAMLEMSELMEEDVAELGRICSGRRLLRQQETGPQEST